MTQERVVELDLRFSMLVEEGVLAAPEVAGAGEFLRARCPELLAFVVRVQTFECLTLSIGNDVGDIFTEPLLVRRFQLSAQLLFTLLFLLFGRRLCSDLAPIGFRLVFVSMTETDSEADDQTGNPETSRFHFKLHQFGFRSIG